MFLRQGFFFKMRPVLEAFEERRCRMFRGRFNQQAPEGEVLCLVVDNLRQLLREGAKQGKEVFVVAGLTEEKQERIPVEVWKGGGPQSSLD